MKTCRLVIDQEESDNCDLSGIVQKRYWNRPEQFQVERDYDAEFIRHGFALKRPKPSTAKTR